MTYSCQNVESELETLTSSLWKIQGKEEQVKSYHSETIRQIRMRVILHDN